MHFYADALVRLLIEPGAFFTDTERPDEVRPALVFLSAGGVFNAAAGLLTGSYAPAVMAQTGAILFINAVGTALTGAVIGYGVLALAGARGVPFNRVLWIYAFSSGMVLLVSWLPFSVWFTEPWRWWLLYTGFKNRCGISWKRAMGVVVVSLALHAAGIMALLLALGVGWGA